VSHDPGAGSSSRRTPRSTGSYPALAARPWKCGKRYPAIAPATPPESAAPAADVARQATPDKVEGAAAWVTFMLRVDEDVITFQPGTETSLYLYMRRPVERPRRKPSTSTVRQIANVVGDHEETILRHIRRGLLKAIRVGRSYRIWSSEADRYILTRIALPRRLPTKGLPGRRRRAGRPKLRGAPDRRAPSKDPPEHSAWRSWIKTWSRF